MKITIKILPLVLAVALCLSLAATALAANSTNPQELSDSSNIDAEAFLPILNAAASDAASFGYQSPPYLYVMDPMQGYVTLKGPAYSYIGEDGFTYTLAGYGAML